MESSLRGDGDEATKGVDSFLDPSNMSLASFEPSLQIIPPTDTIDSPSPSNHHLEVPVSDSREPRTPPLTVADLTAPAKEHTSEDPDSSPLARQVAGRPAAPIIRRRPSSRRALSFGIADEEDRLEAPEAMLKKLEENDSDIEDTPVDNSKAAEGNDTIGSLPFPPQRRASKTLSSFRPVSPSKSSMFQTPAAIRSTMNRLPTETAISQRIRDVEVPPSVMKELESDKRLLGLNEGNNKSGILTLREQGAVIDKLRKENFGLKIKVFYLEGKINQQYDEAARDVMKEVSTPSILLRNRTSN
jgi:Centrosomin N-terminal motif 1